jgi:hypothetical protein
MAGAIYYSEYLGAFHIDYRTFPADTARTWVYGAWALFECLSAALSYAHMNPARVLLAAGGIPAYVMVARALLFLPSEGKTSRWLERSVDAMPNPWGGSQRLNASVRGGLVAVGGEAVLAGLILLALFLLLFPVLIGWAGAQATFVKDSKAYAGGCEHPIEGSLCSKLYEQDKLLGEGFVIAASPDQVALYRDGTTTILDLKGRRLVTEGQPVPKKEQPLHKPSTSTAH